MDENTNKVNHSFDSNAAGNDNKLRRLTKGAASAGYSGVDRN